MHSQQRTLEAPHTGQGEPTQASQRQVAKGSGNTASV
jgi:hypothetical protein